MNTDITTSRTPADRAKAVNAEAIRTIYYENTVESPAGRGNPWNPYTGEPCSVGELKREIGAHQTPPMSYTSVHLIVTGQTHRTAPGPIVPRLSATTAATRAAAEVHPVVLREVYRVGRAPAGQSGRQRTSKRDTATLVSRTAVRGTGERGHLVETTRIAYVDGDGVIVSLGPSLKVEGTVDEGNRELTEGKVLAAMCDPELVLDGRPDGLPFDDADTGADRPTAGGDAK